MYYFPGEPRRTPPLERDPEWWPSEQTFPYTEANKIIADRQDVGLRYTAVEIPIGPNPIAEKYDDIHPELDEYGHVMMRPYHSHKDRSNELPTNVRPNRQRIEMTKPILLKRNYETEVLEQLAEEEQQIADEKYAHKWWMRNDYRTNVDRRPTTKRPDVPPGYTKEEMLLQPEIEFPPDITAVKIDADGRPKANKTPEEWVRDVVLDEQAVQVRRPPTVTRAAENPEQYENQWFQGQQMELNTPYIPLPAIKAYNHSNEINEPTLAPMVAPDGQQIEVVADSSGNPNVRMIIDPITGQMTRVVEGPGGIAFRAAVNDGNQINMVPGPDGGPSLVTDVNGDAYRIIPTPQGRAISAATSSIVL